MDAAPVLLDPSTWSISFWILMALMTGIILGIVALVIIGVKDMRAKYGPSYYDRFRFWRLFHEGAGDCKKEQAQ